MNSTIGVNDVPFAQVEPNLLLKHISRASLAVAHAPANRRGLVTSEIDISCSIYTDMRTKGVEDNSEGCSFEIRLLAQGLDCYQLTGSSYIALFLSQGCPI